MKILMSCRQHPFHLCGGLSIASWNTAKMALAAGHEVHYLTGSHPEKEYSTEEGIHVHWLKGMSHEADGYSFLYDYLRKNSTSLANQYDIFHSQSSALTTLLDCGRPIIFQDHGTQLAAMQDDFNQTAFNQIHTPFYNDKKPYYRLYEEFTKFIEGKEIDYLRRFTRVLATSKISYMDLCTRYYLKNISLFYHCIYDIPESKPRPSNELPIIGFFALGLDSPQKSVIHGLKQLIPIKDKIIIKIIGKGTIVPKFAKENFPNVIFTGYLKETDAIKELSSIDVLFECSCHHRGCNLTAITALGLGVPILAYPTSGHIDLIGEEALLNTFGKGGALIDPLPIWHHPHSKPEMWSAKTIKATDVILEIIKNRVTFSKTAMELFKERFSPEVCTKELNKVYSEIKKG